MGNPKSSHCSDGSATDPHRDQTNEKGESSDILAAELKQMKTMQNDLEARGIPAAAQILTAANMGVEVNADNSLMIFQLQVQATDRSPFQATAQGVVGLSATAKYQPGKTVYVKYDPNDPSKVILDHS